jgi:uncharacterized protein
MAHFLLSYELAPDHLERRTPYREDHARFVLAAAKRGELLLAGTTGDPVDGALLLFTGAGPEVATAFAEADPYVHEGLITAWRVIPWTIVVGAPAAAPARPES